MKKILFAALALLSISLVSCKKEEPLKCDLIGLNDSYSIQAEGQEIAFQVDANVDWVITKANLDWAEITPSQALATAGLVNVKINIQENKDIASREGTFTVKSSVASKTINVTQLGAAPSVSVNSPAAHKCNSKGEFSEGGEMTITSNCAWSISGAADWLTIKPASGDAGTTKVTFSAAENKVKEARSCELTIKAGGSDYKTKYTVSQEAKPEDSISTDVTTVAFEASAGEKTVNVTSNGDWTAAATADWVTINPVKGSGSQAVKVSVPEYNGIRTAKITFTCGTVSTTINVDQIGDDVAGYAELKVGEGMYWNITNSEKNQNNDWNSYRPNPDSGDPTYGTGNATCYADNSPEVNGKKTVYVKWEKAHHALHEGCNSKYNDETNYYWYGQTSNFAAPALAIQNGTYTDDALCFHMPVKGIEKGRSLELTFSMQATGKQPAFWNAEYSIDGGKTWISGSTKLTVYQDKGTEEGVDPSKSADNDKGEYTSANGVKANICVRDHFTGSPTGKAAFTYVVTFNVKEDVSWTEVLARVRVVDGLDAVKGSTKLSDLPATSGTVHFGNPCKIGVIIGTDPIAITLK